MSFFDERRESAKREREVQPVTRSTADTRPSGPRRFNNGGLSSNSSTTGARDYRSRDDQRGNYNRDNRDQERDRNSRYSNNNGSGPRRDHRGTRDLDDRNIMHSRDSRDTRDNRTNRSHSRYDQRRDQPSNRDQYQHHAHNQPQRFSPATSRPYENLENVVPIDKLPREKSLWGVVPSSGGYEGSSAMIAKTSGLFVAPGASAKNIAASEVKRILNKFKPYNETNGFPDNIQVSPLYSINSRIILVKGIDFKIFKAKEVADYFEMFLKTITLPESVTQSIEEEAAKEKGDNQEGDGETLKEVPYISNYTVVNDTLIITTSRTVFASLLLGLNHTTLKQFGDSTPEMSRPEEYVSYFRLNYKQSESVRKQIVENSDLVIISNISPLSIDTEIQETLEKVHKLRSFFYPVDKSSQDGKGFAFCQFDLISSDGLKLEELLSKVQEITLDDQQLKTSTPCASVNGYTQSLFLSSDGLLDLAEGSQIVTPHKVSRVLQFINCIFTNDLVESTKYQDIYSSFKNECSKFGTVEQVIIPKPSANFKIWTAVSDEPGLGKIYVKFSSEKDATNAMNGLAGRLFSGRTVFVRYFSENDLSLGLY